MLGRFVLISSAAIVALTARVPVARAQEPEPVYAPPAHIAFVEGSVTLERDGRPESSALNMPLLSGDRLRTADGRVEIAFADNSTLHLDTRTTVDFQSDELLRLIDGRVRVTIGGRAREVAYRIDAPVGSVRLVEPGVYRVSLLRDEPEPKLELAVLRGGAQLFTDQGTTDVHAGERAYASAGLAPSYAYAYNSAQWDAFDRWSETRRSSGVSASAQYLPQSMQSYDATFDQYGDWRYAESYGYVWYPRVAVGWRPYYYGRWATLPTYGWTWVGADPFAWPTHHYGRWGFSSGVWFWIPGTRWGPAWVSWAYAPGYVSWCPLGFNNHAIVALNVGYHGYYTPWHAWTVVPSSHFHGGFVPRHAMPVDGWRNRPSFVPRQDPGFRSAAISRAAPIRWAGTPAGARGVAVPRAGSNSFSNGPRTATPGGAAFPAPARAPRDPAGVTNIVRGSRGVAREAGTSAPSNAGRAERAPGFTRPERVAPSAGSTVIQRAQPPAGVPARSVDVAPRRDYTPRYQPPSPGYGRPAPTAVPRYDAAPGYGRPAQTPAPRSEAAPYGRPAERTAPSYQPPRGDGRPPETAVPRAMPSAPSQAPDGGGAPGGAPPRGVAVPRGEARPGGSPPAADGSAPASRPAPARGGGGHRGR